MVTPLQSDTGTKAPHTECRIDWLCECSLDSVQKLHAIRHAVKGKYACCMIHIDTNTRRHWSGNVFALVVVDKGKFGLRAVQTPGLVIPAQAAFVAVSFATDAFVSNGNVYLCSFPVHLPVRTAPRHTLPAQHLEQRG